MYITDKKRSVIIEKIRSQCGCQAGCSKCLNNVVLVNKFADANIPVAYWFKPINKFEGSANVKAATLKYIDELDDNFYTGKGLCYSGTLGTGKTYSACCVLKAAASKNYETYYTTLADLVFYSSDNEYKSSFYTKTMRSDFLCIDEIDARHLGDSVQSIDFFGRNLEKIIRYRLQNNLPIIAATNNTGLDDVFNGQFKKVFESLAKVSTTVVPALGKDYRLRKG